MTPKAKAILDRMRNARAEIMTAIAELGELDSSEAMSALRTRMYGAESSLYRLEGEAVTQLESKS